MNAPCRNCGVSEIEKDDYECVVVLSYKHQKFSPECEEPFLCTLSGSEEQLRFTEHLDH